MLHWSAWERGVKSLYYLRSKSVQRAAFAGRRRHAAADEEVRQRAHRLRRVPGLPVGAHPQAQELEKSSSVLIQSKFFLAKPG